MGSSAVRPESAGEIADSWVRPSRLPSKPGPRPAVPDHEILSCIGRGSYGEVWLAKSAVGTLRAVKILWRDCFEHAEHFEREFHGLQKFEPVSRAHDGLVDILQIGRNDGAGYFYYVMELADAVDPDAAAAYRPKTLSGEVRRQGALPVDQCIAIGIALTSALDHLHKHGLVHRDIKPSNIIFVNGLPKLADIGLVTNLEEAHSLVGTIGFIPPEGPGTPQADLYSLGKVLYEISTGQDRQSFPALPPALKSDANRAALFELNEVILKACATDVRQRYQAAADMKADLALLQGGRSVRQLRKLERRVRLATRLTLMATIALGIGGAAWYFQKERARIAEENFQRSEQLRWRAERAEYQANDRLWHSYLAQSRAHRSSGRSGRRFESLAAIEKAAGIRRSIELRNEAIAALALADLRLGEGMGGSGLFSRVMVMDSQFERYARTDAEGTIVIRRRSDHEALVTLAGYGEPAWVMRFSPDGTYLAAKYHGDQSWRNQLWVWDVQQKEPVLKLSRGINRGAVAFHPREAWLAMGRGDGVLRLFNLTNATLIGSFPVERDIHTITFSPEGDRLAISYFKLPLVEIREWQSGVVIRKFEPREGVRGLAWHPDGVRLAAGCDDGQVYVWNMLTGALEFVLPAHRNQAVHVGFAHGGHLLASAGWDVSVHLWDVLSQKKLATAHYSAQVQFAPDDRLLAFADDGHQPRLLEVADGSVCQSLISESVHRVQGASFSPDGTLLAAAALDAILVWESKSRRLAARTAFEDGHTVLFAADGTSLFAAGKTGLSQFALSCDGAGALTISPPVALPVPPNVEGACWTGGHSRIALVWRNAIRLYDPTRQARMTSLPYHASAASVSASPDGKWLATGTWQGRNVNIYDIDTAKLVRELPIQRTASVQFSPDGRWLVIGADEYQFLESGRWVTHHRVARQQSHFPGVIVFAPDLKTVALWDSYRSIQLVNPADGASLATIDHESPLPLCFSPDSNRLVVRTEQEAIQIWDLVSVRAQLQAMKLDW